MKKAWIFLASTFLVFTPALAQDPAKVVPNQCKVTFENEYVRILDWTVGGNQKTPMHEHPALVSIALSGAKSRFTTADGKSRETESKAGQVIWSGPEKHSSENLGSTPARIIQVELKKKPTAAMTTVPAAEDAVKVSPKHYKVELENDRVRVLRINLNAKEKTAMHSHPAGVTVFLADGQARFTLPDGKTENVSNKAGESIWNDKHRHAGENLGRAIEVIQIDLK